ncbi:RNA polymerase sigma-70 factor (ECF subfamily) [Mobilisporobacter senegalensis]|uniref:RNA polymerase sigma-70 factor (ECF subfamily) n=2 Tax=Mobilisporobacter senegalensis TaxID=1329262 RepID=A0A3N1XLB2_9FIRM|nr:RNA polymerase sigma-70 factor (ECF subfamily) [Mobilisporobacter senegalensis]
MVGMRKKVEQKFLSNYQNYYRLAYSYVKNESDAMDIVQESAYKAMKEHASLKKEEYISTWIYRIVINTALDYIRKNKKEIVGIMGEEKSYEDTYMNFDMMDLLNNLEEDDRTIIILRFFEEEKLEDIARITGDNLNTVKTKLYRSLKKLKSNMEDFESSEIGKVW